MRTFLTSLACAALLSVISLSANAQEAGDGGGGGAGGSAFGIGAQSMLRGPGGIAITYDVGLLHFDGILFFVDTDGGGAFVAGDSLGIGGRAFYSVHQTNASDLSVGGGLGFIVEDQGPADDDHIISLEFGAKMRAFIVSNVALTAFIGAAVILDDNDGGDDEDGILIGGQQLGSVTSLGLTSGFGFTYYFH